MEIYQILQVVYSGNYYYPIRDGAGFFRSRFPFLSRHSNANPVGLVNNENKQPRQREGFL